MPYIIRHAFPGEFRQPTDVAVCPVTGRIVVADTGNHRIQVLDASFNHLMDIDQYRPSLGVTSLVRTIILTSLGKVRRNLLYPAYVAVNSDGKIIVSDYGLDRVIVYDKSGAYSRDLLTGCWDKPGGIAVDGDDTLYIVNGTGTIKVINKAGQKLRTIRYGRPTANDAFSCITIYKNQLIVCDKGLLYQVDEMGSSSSSCTKLDYVHSPMGLAVDHSGDLVIVDDEGSVTVFRDGGVVRHGGEHGQQPWQLGGPCGVAVTNTGEIVVANYSHGNLLVYDH